MKEENKLKTISNLFETSEIRSIWNSEENDYYFSVVDVISALTNSENPRNYWNMLKRRMTTEEKSELYTKCVQLKLKSNKDGKFYMTDTLNTQGILRLIESVPSPKAEPFKMWLASLGSERIDEVYDPEIAINRAINYYKNRGYNNSWIETRIKSILNRNDLTEVWKENGINKGLEYAILTNEIYKTWSGMTSKDYKEFKGLRKESLRDNMDETELILTELSENATKRLASKHRPSGLDDNIKIAKIGGSVAKVARDTLEKNLGESVVTINNRLNYKYKEEKQIEMEEQ